MNGISAPENSSACTRWVPVSPTGVRVNECRPSKSPGMPIVPSHSSRRPGSTAVTRGLNVIGLPSTGATRTRSRSPTSKTPEREVMKGFQLPMDDVSTSSSQTTDGTAGRSTRVSMRFMSSPHAIYGLGQRSAAGVLTPLISR